MKRRNNASDVVYVNVAILCNRTWPEKKKMRKTIVFLAVYNAVPSLDVVLPFSFYSTMPVFCLYS